MRLFFAILAGALAGCASAPGVAHQNTHLIEVQNQSWDLLRVEAYCGASMRSAIRHVEALSTVRKAVRLEGCGSVWFAVVPLGGQAYRTESVNLESGSTVIRLRITNHPQHSSATPL